MIFKGNKEAVVGGHFLSLLLRHVTFGSISYLECFHSYYCHLTPPPPGGELHFLQIGGVCDDIDDADIFVDGPVSKGSEQLLEGTKPSSNPSSPGITGRRCRPRYASHLCSFNNGLHPCFCLISPLLVI